MNSVALILLSSHLLCFCTGTAKGQLEHTGINQDGSVLFIGTYTFPDGQGLGIYRYDEESEVKGHWESKGVASTVTNPSFVIANRNKTVLFCVNEMEVMGGVTSLRMDATSTLLANLSHQPSAGSGPAHLALDPTERCLLVANYGSGNVAAYPVSPDGIIGTVTSVVQPAEESIGRASPHAHQVVFDSRGNVAIPFLGLDKVYFYTLDTASCKLRPLEAILANGTAVHLHADVGSGSGCRHLAYGKDGRFFYVVNEVASTITVFDATVIMGGESHKVVQVVSTLPPHYDGQNTGAEVAVHPNGRFLYASNRGHDSVALFAVDPHLGTLTFLRTFSSGGSNPRHFVLDRDGTSLYVANQNSESVIHFALDEDGTMDDMWNYLKVPSPVCVLLLQ